MSELMNKAKSSIWEFRVAIGWFIMFSINALCSAIMISLLNTTWSNLDGEAKFLIVVGVVWNWTNTIMAFTSKQAARIKQTGDIFPMSGDTGFVTKQTTNVSQETIQQTNKQV